jgi:uncharacterized hydantoinase/oxoprolinase family protein
MSASIKRWITGVPIEAAKVTLKKLFSAVLVDLGVLRTPIAAAVTDITALITREKSFVCSPAALTIASGKKTATAAAFTYLANGTLGYKAASDMSALVGTVADGKTAGWVFYIDSAGTITTSSKTADTTGVDAAAVLATQLLCLAIAQPAGKAIIGNLVVSTTGAAFVGGTTDLDAGTATDLYQSYIGPVTVPSAITAVTPAALTLVV